MNAQVRKPGRGASGPTQTAPAAQAEARTADHQIQVALAAYFIAEKRGFDPGRELDDWLAAEAQIASAEQPSVTKPIQPVAAESIS